MLKLYGTSKSRSARCLWALEELGLKYEHVPTEVAKAKSPDNLRLNPNGHIPVLEEDGQVFWESMAINLYLASKYGKPPLWPASAEDRGHAFQWSFWGMTEAEPHLVTILRNRMLLPPEQRNEQAAQQAAEAMKAPLAVLDGALKGRDYLLGKDFTIADLNLSAIMSFAMLAKIDMSGVPAVGAWMQKCLGRDAFKKARSLP
ncbi:MAG TPA: glutathione S-transferase family protein [Candidatus Binataceae bacterium]|nr:glutathione S-transferase family protein [Candidatus Binataceae bacterium]